MESQHGAGVIGEDQPRLQGFLVLIGFVLVLGILYTTYDIVQMLALVPTIMANSNPRIGIWLYLFLIADCLLLWLLCRGAYSFFKLKSNAPKRMIVLLLFSILYNTAVLSLHALGENRASWYFIPVIWILPAALILYFRASQTVKRTFTSR